jgi:hypothetical protein
MYPTDTIRLHRIEEMERREKRKGKTEMGGRGGRLCPS